MSFGEIEPSNFPSADAIRVLKSKTVKQGLHNKDPVVALFIMKSISPFNQAIQDIGYDRFVCTTGQPLNYIFTEITLKQFTHRCNRRDSSKTYTDVW